MSKKEFKPAMKCVFGDGGKTTRTHVYPDWMKRFIELPEKHFDRRDSPVGKGLGYARHFKIKQGSIFSQKPYLACEDCNTGWMKKFEDEIVKFIRPILSTHETVTVNQEQMRTLAAWVSLITILAEFNNKNQPPTISVRDRLYLKEKGEPPSNWSIFAASLEGYHWRGAVRRFTKIIVLGEGVFDARLSEEAQHEIDRGRLTPNTQMSSFGFGNLFIQVFTTPAHFLTQDYRAAANEAGLVQIWPVPVGLWPLTKGAAKFPTKLVLTDETAEKLATAYKMRIDHYIPGKLDYVPGKHRPN